MDGQPITPLSQTIDTIRYLQPSGVSCDASSSVTNPNLQAASLGLNPSPVITNIILGVGPPAGGGTFILLGSGFTPGTTVSVGGTPAFMTTLLPTSITAVAPPGTLGSATVLVTTPTGCGANTSYLYQ